MKFFNVDKNKDIDIDSTFVTSNKTLDLICKNCGYEWQAQVRSRATDLCPCCDLGVAIKKGYNDVFSIVPILKLDFIQKDNPDIDMEKIGVSDKKNKINWNCHVCGYKWKSTVFARTKGHTGENEINKCPICGKAKRACGFDVQYPSLNTKFNAKKNKRKLSEVKGTEWNTSFWWNCEIHGPFQQVFSAMVRAIDTKSAGCPYCKGSKALKEDSFAYNYPELMNELADESYLFANPYETLPSSPKKAFWNCHNNGCKRIYRMPYVERVEYFERKKESCPYCKGHKKARGHYLNDI